MIFIDEGQDAVRGRVQAVKAIAQSEVSAMACLSSSQQKENQDSGFSDVRPAGTDGTVVSLVLNTEVR